MNVLTYAENTAAGKKCGITKEESDTPVISTALGIRGTIVARILNQG